MGIFSRSPRIPEPHIVVQLDETCRGLLRPGSQVAGLATAQSPVQRNLRSARIVLAGRSVTHSTRTQSQNNAANNINTSRTIHYHDDAALFMLEQVVSQQTSMEQDVPYTFRFDFQFPGGTADVVGESPYTGKRSSERGLFQDAAHALPATFAYERSHYHYARVQYDLQAEFVFEDALDKPIVIPMEPINFCPARPMGDLLQLIEISNAVEKYSSSRLAGGEKSFMNSVKDKFSKETPSVMVGFKCSLPTHFSPGANFPIYACVELDSFSHPDIPISIVNVRCKSIKLHPVTFWRALREHGANWGYQSEKEEDHEETILLNAVPETAVVDAKHDEYAKGKVGFPVAFEARIPGDVCPSFSTFNVVNAYSLKVVLEAEVAGKEFELKAEGSVTVLPP